MIRSFRHIALGGSTRRLTGITRCAAHAARIGSLFTVLVFFLDTINADIIYAAVIGDVRFEDNPLILDSATDSTSVVPVSGHVNYFQLAQFDSRGLTNVHQHLPPHFLGTTIVEDVDSPTVLDGATTQHLTFVVTSYFADRSVAGDRTYPTLDRTIVFGCLQI